VDITVLIIGHELKIACFLPDAAEKPEARTPNRIPAGGEGGTLAFRLSAEEPELERVVVLAVEAAGEKPVDFAWMADDMRAKSKPRSPLGKFLAGSLFGNSPRGSTAPSTRYQVVARSWVIMPAAR
jgi:hypothetical protein